MRSDLNLLALLAAFVLGALGSMALSVGLSHTL